ncbi:MAG: EF-hand domain-containing protein [Croceibacterium sp.]
MNRIVLGGFLALIMVAIGLFWLQGRAEVEKGAPPPRAAKTAANPDVLPTANAAGQRGPTPPEASELTREQQRFFRYDHDRDNRITRNEMLSSRTDAFRKLDKDGNNLLTFEEWAVATAQRFDGADANRDGELSHGEFATTAPKPAPKPKCGCSAPRSAQAQEPDL